MHCALNTCKSGRKLCTAAECRAPVPLMPPLFAWLRREIVARCQIPRWYATNRSHGFNRRRSIVIAWTTTRPIHSTRNTK